MAYGIRIIIDFIYGNEHHQRSWAAAPVSFKGRKGAEGLCFTSWLLLGMFIAWMTATGYATNQIKEQMISWGFGALAVVAVLVRLCGKSKNAALAAKLLAAASVVLGMVALFIG